jgi:hypothetical protein
VAPDGGEANTFPCRSPGAEPKRVKPDRRSLFKTDGQVDEALERIPLLKSLEPEVQCPCRAFSRGRKVSHAINRPLSKALETCSSVSTTSLKALLAYPGDTATHFNESDRRPVF